MPDLSLDMLRPGESARIDRLLSSGAQRRRFLELGLIPGTRITCLGVSPLHDPCAYRIRGVVIAIRRKDGRTILVKSVKGNAFYEAKTDSERKDHRPAGQSERGKEYAL